MESADVENFILPIIENEDIELVEIKIAGNENHRLIRVFIDKEGGISVKECAYVSKQLSAVLDVEWDNENYVLEVSSPGLDRPLKNQRDFSRCTGKEVIVNFSNEDGEIKKCSGVIVGTEEYCFKIKNDKSVTSISYDSIINAVLKIRF